MPDYDKIDDDTLEVTRRRRIKKHQLISLRRDLLDKRLEVTAKLQEVNDQLDVLNQ